MPFRRYPAGELFPSEPLKDPEAITAYIDGGARGNPGPGGYGVHIRDAGGKTLAELSEYLGHCTNNFAEYSGLIAALQYAVKHAHPSLRVFSDSELLVKQMRGQYKVKSPELQLLHRRAKELASGLGSVEIRHVPREKNREADRLANLAMDKGTNRSPAAARAHDAGEMLAGVVRNGRIEFEGTLPEGTRVKIRPAVRSKN